MSDIERDRIRSNALFHQDTLMYSLEKDPKEVDQDDCLLFDYASEVAGVTTSMSFFNLLEPIKKNLDASDKGEFVLGDIIIRKVDDLTDSLNVHLVNKENEEVLYSLMYKQDRTRKEYHPWHFKVYKNNDKDLDSLIAHGSMSQKKNKGKLSRTYGKSGSNIVLSETVQVLELLKPLLEPMQKDNSYQSNEKNDLNGLISEFIDLINYDGGVSGELTQNVIEVCRNQLLDSFAPVLASRFHKLHDELSKEAVVWDNKKLEYGDNIVFVIPTNELSKVCFIEKINTLSNYNRYVSIVEQDADNNDKALKIFKLHCYNNDLRDFIERIQMGTLSRVPDIEYDLEKKKIIIYSDDQPDMLIKLNRYSIYACEEINNKSHLKKKHLDTDFDCYAKQYESVEPS